MSGESRLGETLKTQNQEERSNAQFMTLSLEEKGTMREKTLEKKADMIAKTEIAKKVQRERKRARNVCVCGSECVSVCEKERGRE